MNWRRLRGNTIRGNRTESLREESVPPRGPLKTSENLRLYETIFLDIFEIFAEDCFLLRRFLGMFALFRGNFNRALLIGFSRGNFEASKCL